jgi:PRTRC genetic system protein B
VEIHLSIGQNHCFELREALLVYRDRQSSFITRHDVVVQKSGPPTLGPAQPLTFAFVESLMRSLGGSVQAEVLPANILAKADRMIVWWTPARRRQMFYENAEGKASDLNGRIFPQPPLVWKVASGELSVRALAVNKRPQAKTTLAVAPFWNLSDDGRVCTGTMRRPESRNGRGDPGLGTRFLRKCLHARKCWSHHAPRGRIREVFGNRSRASEGVFQPSH